MPQVTVSFCLERDRNTPVRFDTRITRSEVYPTTVSLYLEGESSHLRIWSQSPATMRRLGRELIEAADAAEARNALAPDGGVR